MKNRRVTTKRTCTPNIKLPYRIKPAERSCEETHPVISYLNAKLTRISHQYSNPNSVSVDSFGWASFEYLTYELNRDGVASVDKGRRIERSCSPPITFDPRGRKEIMNTITINSNKPLCAEGRYAKVGSLRRGACQ